MAAPESLVRQATLTLTDDEAVALAMLADGTWRPPLPTVNDGSDAELTAALLRGRRSLVVRELAEPDGTMTGAAAEVRTRSGAGPRAAFLLLDARGNWVPSGVTIYLYGPTVDDIELSHIITAAGVHYFRVTPPPRQWQALTEIAQAVFDDGLAAVEGGARPPASALLLVSGPQGVKSVRVAKGQVSVARPAGAGTFGSVSHAAGWLIA
jgi:hypothetical protein